MDHRIVAMGLSSELETEVEGILRVRWQSREGRVVPETENLSLGNDAVRLNGAVLYADLVDSTGLVQCKSPAFAAEIYKCFLHCASKIIKKYGGVITAFDGDRVMAVYIGDRMNSNAVRSAFAINHAVTRIINPRIESRYPNEKYSVRHAVGIDTSSLLVAKTGIRRYNDLVWVGAAANIAAKLCALRNKNYCSWITEGVYKRLGRDMSVSQSGFNMWERCTWSDNGMIVYRSNWWWAAE